MKHIPLHKLQERSNNGLWIERLRAGNRPVEIEFTFDAHRGDHYIFLILEKGNSSGMVDFNEIELEANTLFYVLPSQVHHRVRDELAEGWFLAVDTILILPAYRDIFEHRLLLQQPYKLSKFQQRQFSELLLLTYKKSIEPNPCTFYISVLHGLLQAFLGMAVCCYNDFPDTYLNKLSRTTELSRAFKKLLSEHFYTIKSPVEYAKMLNVSAVYLNEVLKKTTGFSVSYWIQQEIMMEAKRLLYYSELTVKEIAYSLGYDDHSYFSRLFRKVVGMPAVSFRLQYRK